MHDSDPLIQMRQSAAPACRNEQFGSTRTGEETTLQKEVSLQARLEGRIARHKKAKRAECEQKSGGPGSG
ncbi:hypothetical protein PS3A_32060 [Pseudomonas sp. 3A(2025)]